MNKQILSIGIALWAISAQAQAVNIPDANFKYALLNQSPNIDLNNNGEIELSEAETVTYLNVSDYQIQNMTGIQAFTSLNSLDCFRNKISLLDVSKNLALTKLYCNSNNLTTLDVSQNILLTELVCPYNNIQNLDLSKNVALTSIGCHSNQLNSLDVSQNTLLSTLNCSANNISFIDIRTNTSLRFFLCSNNPITYIDLTKNYDLYSLEIIGTKLSSLNLAQNSNLTYANCSSNSYFSVICINISQINKTKNWTKDYFTEYNTSCGTVTAIEDKFLYTNKKLIRILTPLGQELQPEQATEGLFIYQYSDGSTRKVMKQ